MFSTPRLALRWLAPALAVVLCLTLLTPSPGLAQEGDNTAVATAPLNMRSGPAISNSVVTVIPSGATVTVTGAGESGFLPVSWDGASGWASSDYLTGSAPADSGTSSETGTAYTTSFLNFRTGPATSYGIISVIPNAAMVTLTGQSADGFISVSYDGYEGWVSADYVTTTPEAAAPAPEPEGPAVSSMVTTSSLNMRTDASLAATVITVIPSGVAVSVTGSGQNGFLPITYDGQQGWASADFLQEGSEAAPAPAPAPETGGSGIIWPVSGGTWSIIQGYNGGTHQNRSASAQYYYSLDIARTDGDTAGQAVYAPASGTILWLDPGSGGIAIDMNNGYIVTMFHSTFDGSLSRGQGVDQGQYLGTVSGPGGAGYASTPHVEITLSQTSGNSRSATPFSGNNAISGMSFEDVGGSNQHGGTTFNP